MLTTTRCHLIPGHMIPLHKKIRCFGRYVNFQFRGASLYKIMTHAFQEFHGKQRMLSDEKCNAFQFPNNFNKGHRYIFSLPNLRLFQTKQPKGQYAASPEEFEIRRVHARSVHAQCLPRSVSPLMIAFSSARSSFFMRMSSGTWSAAFAS